MLAVVAPTAAAAFGPESVIVFGTEFPVMSMALSLVGLVLARLVTGAREGRHPGDLWLTVLLCVLLIALVIERQPGPGMAVFWGVGLGAAGILAMDIVKKGVVAMLKAATRGGAGE
jgi:hypothetical protein